MNISVMSYSFTQVLRTGEMDTAATIRFGRELGVTAVEVTDNFVQDADLPEIQKALDESGSTVVCYDVSGDFITPDRAARQEAVSAVAAGLARAAALGAPRVLVTPGSLKEGMSPAVARQWIVEGLKDCIPEALRLGITLTLEDHSSQAATYGRSDHLNAICDGVGPPLAITFDVGNFLLAGEDPMHALEQLAPRVVHVHLKDWHVVPAEAARLNREVTGLNGRRYTGTVLGAGIVDLRSAVAGLGCQGYHGYVSVEYEGMDDPRDAVTQGVTYARALLSANASLPERSAATSSVADGEATAPWPLSEG